VSFTVIALFKFHEGKLEELERLPAQCMEIVRTKDIARCNTTSTSTTISPSASPTSGIGSPRRSSSALPTLATVGGNRRAGSAPVASITDDDLVPTGESDLENLRRRAAHAGPIHDDTFVYRVEFHVLRQLDDTRQ
jgi:hypothetical protein